VTLPGLRSRFCRTLWPAVLASACFAAHAEIVMAVSNALLHSEQSCDLQAAHDDGRPGRWHWTVLETAGGRVVPGAAGQAKYHAPRTLVNRLIHVQVLDEADPLRVAVHEIRVVPGLEGDLMNWVMGPNWNVPKMTVYAGDPEEVPGAVNTHFTEVITGICPIDDPAMPEGVNHHLAVADENGIQMVSPGRPPAECAALTHVSALAFSASGMLLVGTSNCIVELDMPRFVAPARLAHPEGAEAKEPRPGPAAAAAAGTP